MFPLLFEQNVKYCVWQNAQEQVAHRRRAVSFTHIHMQKSFQHGIHIANGTELYCHFYLNAWANLGWRCWVLVH